MASYTTDIMVMSGGADVTASPKSLVRISAPLSGGADVTAVSKDITHLLSTPLTLSGGADTIASSRSLVRLSSSLSGGADISANPHKILYTSNINLSSDGSLVESKITTRVEIVDGAQYEGVGTVTLHADLWRWHTAKANPLVVESKLEMFIFDQRDIKQSVDIYIPKYYKDSTHAQAIFSSEVNESIRLHSSIVDILNQLYIQTATWGLDRWEELFSIKTDYSLSYDVRRSTLLERIDGFYLVTTTVLGQEANKFFDTIITQDTGNFEVIITIKDRQVLSSLDPIKYNKFMSRMRTLIPSHLNIEIKFVWVPWQEVYNSDLRFEEALNYTWNQFITQYYSKPMFEWEDVARWDELEQQFSSWDAFSKKVWSNMGTVNDVSDDQWIVYETEWNELHGLTLEPNLSTSSWEDIEQYTFEQIDTQVTNKWEVTI